MTFADNKNLFFEDSAGFVVLSDPRLEKYFLHGVFYASVILSSAIDWYEKSVGICICTVLLLEASCIAYWSRTATQKTTLVYVIIASDDISLEMDAGCLVLHINGHLLLLYP